MPGPSSAVRSPVLAAVAGVLVATMLGLPGAAEARDAGPDRQPPLPSSVLSPAPSSVLPVARDGSDVGNPGYHYAAAHTQVLPTAASGLRATLSVHRPAQVRGRRGQHSLGQVAVGHTLDRSYLEAGWRQFIDGPRLFVYWRPGSGRDTCYNFGCGFRPKGPGLRPGTQLSPGSEVTIAFQHTGNRWWLKVDGKKSGYFPDRLWRGRFTGTNFAQVYGEVFTPRNQKLCADMGSGKPASHPQAAFVRAVSWISGPPMLLRKAPTVREIHRYGYRQTSPSSFRYGGPGEC